MITNCMDCLWHRRCRVSPKAATGLLVLLMIGSTTLAKGQSVFARLELEATTTTEFGRVLSVRTVIKNETGRNIFLTNFLPVLHIEKLNDRHQFEDYFDGWFGTLRFDSTREAIENRCEIRTLAHDSTYDKSFFKELKLFNRNAKDSVPLHHWCNRQVEQIQTFIIHGHMEFRTNVNSLPAGKYRLRYTHISNKNGVPILPTESFAFFKIPNTLADFGRWTGRIESEYLYLTIN